MIDVSFTVRFRIRRRADSPTTDPAQLEDGPETLLADGSLNTYQKHHELNSDAPCTQEQQDMEDGLQRRRVGFQ